AALQDRLSHFVAILFGMNRFQSKPLFRGFYFTSAAQDGGSPIDFVIGRLRRTFGFAQVPERPELDEDRDATGYFITDLFTTVIFRDHVLTPPPPKTPQESRRKRWLIIGITAAVSLFVLIGSLVSFFRNQSLVNDVTEATKKATKGPSKNRPDGLEDLRLQ